MSNTIKLKNYLNVFEEFVANAGITPGHLVEVMSTGKVRVHTTAEGNVLPMFAIEDELQGNDIDTAYVAADQVQVWIPTRGDIVNAILADEENVAIGDFLTSAGDGTLKKYDPAASAAVIENPALIVGVAVSALNLSSSSAATIAATRIAVRII
jgi:hypothetical protein